jgi:hypothetical protein
MPFSQLTSERCMQYVPPNHWYLCTKLNGVTSYKTVILIFISVPFTVVYFLDINACLILQCPCQSLSTINSFSKMYVDVSSPESRTERKHKDSYINKSNLIMEQLRAGYVQKMLTTIRSESFVFSCLIKKRKDLNTQKCYFACRFVRVWNLVSHITGKHRLSVFENRVLRSICGPKTEELITGWRNLHNAELHNSDPSPNTSSSISVI